MPLHDFRCLKCNRVREFYLTKNDPNPTKCQARIGGWMAAVICGRELYTGTVECAGELVPYGLWARKEEVVP